MPKQTILVTLCVCATAITIAAMFANAGPLTPPPGPVAATHGPEARVPLTQATTPGNVANVFIISQPGSYYLTDNVPGGAGQNGVLITTGDVTLDLNGFALLGAPGSQSGVFAALNPDQSLNDNIEVRSGSASGWGGSGVVVFASNSRVEDVRSAGNGGVGIFLQEGVVQGCVARGNALSGFRVGAGTVASNCVATENTEHGFQAIGDGAAFDRCTARNNTLDGFAARVDLSLSLIRGSAFTGCIVEGNNFHGIRAGESTVIENCVVRGSASAGIQAGEGSSIVGCAVDDNGGDGIFVQTASLISRCIVQNSGRDGISTARSTISNCTVWGSANRGILSPFSTISGCTVLSNELDGIVADSNSLVEGNTSVGNGGDGIRVLFRSLVRNNNCDSNGAGAGVGAGIRAAGRDSRIEGNSVTGNDVGIEADFADNLIIRNVANSDGASGNTINYDIVAGNKVGVIVSAPASVAISGDTGGAGVGSTDPWANFSF